MNSESASGPGTTSEGSTPAIKKYVIERHDRFQDDKNLSTFLTLITGLPIQQSWSFKIGLPLIAGSIGLTSMFIHNHFRKSLMLMHYMRVSSYIAMVAVPTVAGTFTYAQYISEDIVTQKTKCSVCLQTRAAMFQGGFAVVYPLILAPLVSFPTAGAVEGPYFPKLTKQPKQVFGYLLEILKPIWGKLRVITLCHIVLAMGVAHFQYDTFQNNVIPYIESGGPKKKEQPPAFR